MAHFYFVVDPSGESIKAHRAHFIMRADNDAADPSTSILAPLPDVAGELHETPIPISHFTSRESTLEI
jgi:hypothetical protein